MAPVFPFFDVYRRIVIARGERLVTDVGATGAVRGQPGPR
jgi:hypothetical protein